MLAGRHPYLRCSRRVTNDFSFGDSPRPSQLATARRPALKVLREDRDGSVECLAASVGRRRGRCGASTGVSTGWGCLVGPSAAGEEGGMDREVSVCLEDWNGASLIPHCLYGGQALACPLQRSHAQGPQGGAPQTVPCGSHKDGDSLCRLPQHAG